MKNLNGKEVLGLLLQNAERKNFERWRKPIDFYYYFLENVYLQTNWSSWFKIGYIDGAIALNYLINIENANSGEYQCLMHHFCILRELDPNYDFAGNVN